MKIKLFYAILAMFFIVGCGDESTVTSLLGNDNAPISSIEGDSEFVTEHVATSYNDSELEPSDTAPLK